TGATSPTVAASNGEPSEGTVRAVATLAAVTAVTDVAGVTALASSPTGPAITAESFGSGAVGPITTGSAVPE
ncbi:hypothetical protein, partial [Mycobacterium tuberculosis]